MSDPVELSIRQFSDAWQVMCAGAPGNAVAAADDVQYVFSGVPIGFFNIALLTGRGISSDALQAHARDASSWASKRRVPWLFVVTHERLAPNTDATAVLDGSGFAPIMPLTGMLAQQVAPAATPRPGWHLPCPRSTTGVRPCSTSMPSRTRWNWMRARI